MARAGYGSAWRCAGTAPDVPGLGVSRGRGAGLRAARLPVVAAVTLATLVACDRKEQAQPVEPRPVRTVVIKEQPTGESVTFTGRLSAEDEVSLAFRIGGRVLTRPVNVGDQVAAAQVLATLDPQDEVNALRSAQTRIAAAEAALVESQAAYERQRVLVAQGHSPRALYDQARRALRTAQAQLDDANVQFQIASDQVTFTVLQADAPGVVTARGAEPGEVVQAGQMIVRLARQGGRDAVFGVPAQVLRQASPGSEVTVRLADDPTITATGRVREVAPQADPVTRTFEIKVGLTDPPEAMRLGATVIGTAVLNAGNHVVIPASALIRADAHPAVWIVDPKSLTVALRSIEPLRFDPASVVVAGGLHEGDVVVTAGVQMLHPGQKVRLLGPPA